ncbi:unnamed protein product, partial [Mesorhabditis belari]|uniref:MATH domain-containing protein n=1 Tax=Mesorhabditis belari TaxID=2138241 RepID=A0AAF3J7C2_9BILA
MTQYFGRSNFSFRSVYPLGGLDWELCLSNPDHHFQLFVGCGTSRQGVTWSCKAKSSFFSRFFNGEDFLVDKNFLKDDKATFIVAIEIENISIKSTQGIDQLKEFTLEN